MIFCTPFTSPTLDFRPIDPHRDLLSSELRRRVLPGFTKHELNLSEFTQSGTQSVELLTRGEAGKRLGRLQKNAALATWSGPYFYLCFGQYFVHFSDINPFQRYERNHAGRGVEQLVIECRIFLSWVLKREQRDKVVASRCSQSPSLLSDFAKNKRGRG